MPRLEIEAGTLRFLAFAADGGSLVFYGLVQVADERPGRWRQYSIDVEGNVIEEGRRHRIRRMDWDDGQEAGITKSWPEFARARKVRSGN